MTSLVLRVAARYKKKMLSEEGNTIYTYSERQVALRNTKKAERLEKLRKSVHKLRARVKKDLRSKDPETLLTALVVGLMDHTAERVGNEESKEERGHVGVTGWQKGHVSFSKGKATIKYTGKSGVKQKKEVSEKALVSALRKAHEACKEGDLFCHEGGKITAAKVNAYLKEFDITAKDLRGLHANSRMQDNLKAVRKKGGELPTDAKKRKEKLKAEFKEALEITAEDVGHEPSTLRSQYLVPGLEEEFMKGRVMSKMVKAKLEVVDNARIEKLRKDFLLLVKNVPHVIERLREGDSQVYDEFRGISRDYSANLKQFLFSDFVGTVEHDESIGDEGASYLKRKLSDAAWELTGLLWDVVGRGYPNARSLEEWDRKVRRLAPAAWKGIKEAVAWYEERGRKQVTLKAPDRLVIEGFQLEIVGFDANVDYQYEQIEHFREALRVYRRQAKKTLPWLLEHQLPLVLDFHADLDEGGFYRSGKDILISGLLFNMPPVRVAKTLAHEMGHHLYKHLSGGAEKFWEAALKGSRGTLDISELLAAWPRAMAWSMDFVQAMATKDPTLAVQVDVLSFGHGGGKAYDKRQDFEDALAEGLTSLAVPKVPISGYAGKSPEEAFCEAVGYLVAYGPRAVHEQVRHWLEIVIPGMTKLATYERVAASYIVAQRVAARYLEAKGKAKGLSLLPDFNKALAKLKQGDSDAMMEFAGKLGALIVDHSKADWVTGLSVQKRNALNRLYRSVQTFMKGDGASLKDHPVLLPMVLRDVETWAKPIRTFELASALGDEVLEIKRGPFTIVPIPGLTRDEIEGALEALDAAIAKLRPKCPKVLYGKVFLTKHLSKTTAAHYVYDRDGLALDVTAKKRFDDVFTIIHELGHRFDNKFLSKAGREKYWGLSTQKVLEKIHFDAKLREQMADEIVSLTKLKALGKPVPAPSETLVIWLKSAHPHQGGDVRTLTTAFLKGQLDEAKLHAAVKGKGDADVQTDKVVSGPLHVTPYGGTKPSENWADGFAHFILGMDMPAELAAILADELK